MADELTIFTWARNSQDEVVASFWKALCDRMGLSTTAAPAKINDATAISERWRERVELAHVIERIAYDLWTHFGEGGQPAWITEGQGVPEEWERYPGNGPGGALSMCYELDTLFSIRTSLGPPT